MPGILYIVSTPIGNLEDITVRALRVLGEVDLIAAEDTRRTRKLLTHFNIKTRMTSYHSHNQRQAVPKLIERLSSGEDLALVTDAGTPAISDPGVDLVKAAIENGITVIPVPGASALVAALTVSGLRTDLFTFIGFLPRKKGMRGKKLADLMAGEPTVVIYESSRRLVKLLAEINEIDGDRPVVVARELTKIYEEIKRGTAAELVQYYTENEPAGEVVLMIAGAGKAAGGSLEEAVALAEELMESESMKPSAAAKEAARRTGISKGEIYKELI